MGTMIALQHKREAFVDPKQLFNSSRSAANHTWNASNFCLQRGLVSRSLLRPFAICSSKYNTLYSHDLCLKVLHQQNSFKIQEHNQVPSIPKSFHHNNAYFSACLPHISWLFICDRHRFRRGPVIHDSHVARNLGHGPSVSLEIPVVKRRRSSKSWSKARMGDCTRPQKTKGKEKTHTFFKKFKEKNHKTYQQFSTCFFVCFLIFVFFEGCDINLWSLMMSISLSASWKSISCELKV